jgi:hypothetical protein
MTRFYRGSYFRLRALAAAPLRAAVCFFFAGVFLVVAILLLSFRANV